jgi:Glycoside hydrolase 123, catalytic domain/Glycoside hydrolase 123 N-terminal domain
VACVAALLALPLTARAAKVWATSSSEKVLPSAGARSLAAVGLTAAKNEFEAFQIAVTADAGAISGVSATATALAGPRSIAAPRLFREDLITLANASSDDGFTGDVPDALVPDVDDVVGEKRNAFPFDVESGQTRVIWAEVHVPADALPGVYQGSVTVSAGGSPLATVPVTLTVWDFALPSTSSLKSHFALYYGDLPAQHGVSGDALSALRARYAQLGLDHRISMGGIDDGNGDLNHFAQFYGALVDGSAPTQLQGAKLTSVQFMGSRSASAYASWASFFKARGWFDRLFDYTCDEPPQTCAWSDIPARNAIAKQGDPNFRTLVTTTAVDADANGALSSIDILTPVVDNMDYKPGANPSGTQPGLQRPTYDAFLASGPQKEIWMYQSCDSHGCGGSDSYSTGWPSYMIDTASLRSRAMEWLSFAWGITGELYWETTWAYATGSEDPWTDQWRFTGNGDGNLFYPGKPSRIGGATDIPVASLRLKMIREGMEDFEYLKLLSDAGDPQLAKQLVASLFPNAWTEPSVSDLLAARERIAARILELTGKPAAPAASTPAGSSAPANVAASGAGSGSAQGATDPAAAATRSAAAGVGSGCSAGASAEELAGLGLIAALAVRRRRRR